MARIAQPARQSHRRRDETAGATPVVLIVEDDRHVRARIVRVLSGRGVAVTAVADAEAALRIAESGIAVDVLITDWALPGVDGLELARRLQSRHRSLATVVVSGLSDAARACARAGAVFVRKPFATRDLVEAVGSACEQSAIATRRPSPRSGSPRPRPS